MTKEGVERYTTLRDQHYASVAAVFGKIRIEIAKIEEHHQDVEALQAIQNTISALQVKHSTLVSTCQDFLIRSQTEQSKEDSENFRTTTNNNNMFLDEALACLQGTITKLTGQETAPSNISVASSKVTAKRAKAEAAKARLHYAKKEAEIKKQKAALQRVWDRLDERYGAPEMIEASLRQKLANFPKLTNKDAGKLYELADILSEVESVKEDQEYGPLLSYYDTSAGINPIVVKLPSGLQEKWTTHAVQYMSRHHVRYPPFAEFAQFVRYICRIKNNPCFMFDSGLTMGTQLKIDRTSSSKDKVVSRKTEVADNVYSKTSPSDAPPKGVKEDHCPIHKTKHSLAVCRAFRSKPIAERRHMLKKNRGCYKCCEFGHQAKECKAMVHCDCGSNDHPTALHVDGEEERKKFSTEQKEPSTTTGPTDDSVTTKCTRMCDVPSKSCAKMVLVKIFPEGDAGNSVKAYAIIDDQSNRSLARSTIFDQLNIDCKRTDYTLTSCNGRVRASGRKAHGLIIESTDGAVQHRLPPLIECEHIPDSREEIPTPDVARRYAHLHDIETHINPVDQDAEILLLIGRDLTEAHHVHDQRIGLDHMPFAQKLSLGWVIIGESCLGGVHQPDYNVVVNKTAVLTSHRPSMFTSCPNLYETREHPGTTSSEFHATNIFNRTEDDDRIGTSVEDRDFLQIMDGDFRRTEDGSWVAPLPFRQNRPRLPNNKAQALKRAKALSSSLRRDPLKKQHFITFMEGIISDGHAELAPPLKDGEECWYLPIFGVYHPKKPDQLRGVFDSSAKFNGVCLNDVLLSGPDMNNNLLGILLRFRRGEVAVMADIQRMFYCFRVSEKHRNFLRFLWYRDNCPNKVLVEYRMCVHVFGNTSSPAVATYGLRRTAQLGEEIYGTDMKEFVHRNFYVDDGLTSLLNSKQAIDLLQRTQQALKEGGLRLHKITSNSREVMDSFPEDDIAKDLRLRGLDSDAPVQRSLGVSWDVTRDTFTFSVGDEDKPGTRRGILSTVNSLYDPIGFLAPVTVQGKIILRELVSGTSDWDMPIPEEIADRWKQWKESLWALNNLQIPRMYIRGLSSVTRKELHIFSDASEKAIATVAYLKTIAPADNQVSFVLGKTKVAPKHAVTMPRLELCAALLAAEIGTFIKDNLDLAIEDTVYHSDSKVVLGYITNRTRRFYVYVTNRVQNILRHTRPEQWNYVPTHLNPADLGTRAVPAQQLAASTWLQGPEFLHSSHSQENTMSSMDGYALMEDDVEIRPEVTALATNVNKDSLGCQRFTRFSKWTSLLKAVAQLTRVASTFSTTGRPYDGNLDAKDLERAKRLIIRETQLDSFVEEMDALQKGSRVSKNSSIVKLDPYLDANGLLRVGGRLKSSKLGFEEKHPLIIDKSQHIAILLVRHYHEKVKHQGRHFTEGTVRAAGMWIVGSKRLVSSIIFRCVTCRKLRGRQEVQKMADLPPDRLEPGAPFTNVGVDTFGPWEIVSRRTRGGQANSKRWAVIFSCLTTRAIHIEVIEELSSSSFINALRRLHALRGVVKTFRSDCGTNFVGCVNLLKEYLLSNGIEWIFNPPHASHMGGAWERMIGIVRRILDSMMLHTSNKVLTHEVLVTFMAEVCAIVNARPLVSVSTDPENPQILSPSMLLTQKVNLPCESHPQTTDQDLYRAQWKRVRALADAFWNRWSSEYLVSLQGRHKWKDAKRNVKEGDLVLLKDKECHRNNWPVGLITKATSDEDGLTRKVEVRVYRDGGQHVFTRPVTEVIVLLES